MCLSEPGKRAAFGDSADAMPAQRALHSHPQLVGDPGPVKLRSGVIEVVGQHPRPLSVEPKIEQAAILGVLAREPEVPGAVRADRYVPVHHHRHEAAHAWGANQQ
jgi:hypothetical protein